MTGPELRAIRDRLCMTQAELGAAVYRTANTVARYERDELPIPPEVAALVRQLDD